AVVPALSRGEAGAQAASPGAAGWREARVRLPPVRDAVREQGRTPPASRGAVSTHAHSGHAARRVACAVVTVSDTRTEATDTSGRRMRELLEAAGHRVVGSVIVRDEPDAIRARIEAFLMDAAVDAVLLNGGTGLAPRDTTYEAVDGLLEKRIDGFGELFRMLSFQEIGSAAMLSRAVAGVARGRVVAILPGSTAGVELGMERLLVPELGHLVTLLGR